VSAGPPYNRRVPRPPLPIDSSLDRVTRAVRDARALVLVATPGAGKTTRVPPAIAADGPVIVLQPRRVAARAIAAHIAREQQWTLGEEVGWHVRFERRFSPRTRVLLATEGILTARLLQDPLLSDFRTIVLDEFHERSIHADIGIALAKQAWLARDDLRVIVMSATIDPTPIAAFFHDCPVIDIPGQPHPIDIHYAPSTALATSVDAALRQTSGNVLCFLPGAPEIRKAMPSVQAIAAGVETLALHGSLDAAEQDRALEPSSTRRVILATNIAETSLTVPGVQAVVDTGLHKIARFDAARGIDSLETERIPQDAANQRTGRAGRLGPGAAWRLWDRHDRLEPQRDADIVRIDLSGPLLDLLAWGATADTFDWFAAPPPASLDAAMRLLVALGAVTDGRMTALGRTLQAIPLPPRLSRILIDAKGSRPAARACALLSERHLLPPRHEATTCDLLAALDRWGDVPAHTQRVARDLEALAARLLGTTPAVDLPETDLRRALFAGYADRLAKRRAPGSPRVLLASGAGAVLDRDSGVQDAEYVAALDVQGSGRADQPDARVRIASAVERSWIASTALVTTHWWDDAAGRVRAARREMAGVIVLAEHMVEPDADAAARLLADVFRARPLSDADEQVTRRLTFAGHPVSRDALIVRAAAHARGLQEMSLARALTQDDVRTLDRLAPATLTVPGGRTVRLEYESDGGVSASVKLQELFGLAETPRVGRAQAPVLFKLLAPNGRPVQTTRDLRSFWERTYPDVRKELRGRYPRHPWPEDPWTAPPTARALPRRRS